MSEKDKVDEAKGAEVPAQENTGQPPADQTSSSTMSSVRPAPANAAQANSSPKNSSPTAATEQPDPGIRGSATTGTATTESNNTSTSTSENRLTPETPVDGTPASKNRSTKAPTSGGGGRRSLPRLLIALLIVLLAGAVSAGLWYQWQQLQQQKQQQQQQSDQAAAQVAALREQLAASEARLDELAREQQQLSGTQTEQTQLLAEQLEVVEQQLSYQGSRLRALSTTTRDDWLLAEAEYLLKLASQRLMVERSTETAQGLLQQADTILRDLEDPQLRPLRKAISADLTQLKLAAGVDREGLYLRLSSLAESVRNLPVHSAGDAAASFHASMDAEGTEPPATAEEAEPAGWWQRVKVTFKDMFSGLDDLVRIRDHAEAPAAILPPDATVYLEQNLRLMLERAQIAAMREDAQVYQRSLTNAEQWLHRFYPPSRERENFITAVKELAAVEVQQELPDISRSLQMLSNYIDRLHKLDGVEVEDGAAPDSGDQVEAQP